MAKKKNRAASAAAGTKLDPNRTVKPQAEESLQKRSKNDSTAHPEWAPHLNSAREQRTQTIFTIVEVVLVLIPVAMLGMVTVGMGGLTSENLQNYFAKDPAFLVTFIAACLQPFVAYLLRIVYKRYSVGDAGYTIGNLIALLCSEMFLLSIPGMVGMAVLIWRVWRNTSAHMSEWAHERGIGGVIFDISGAIVVFVFAAICAFANWRISNAS